MRPWMLEAPHTDVCGSARQAFALAWESRNLGLLPADVPRWVFLQWLTGQGYLLHGSAQPNISHFEPRTPHDLSPDDFSKRTGVFATSDALWALMYGLRDRSRVARMLNMALQGREEGRWSEMRYFLSLAPRGVPVADGRALLSSGFVYVLPGDGFEIMRPYDWPGLGFVREPHWVNPDAVVPLGCVPVAPADFPLSVRTHNAERVDRLCAADPWGFPWLDE